MNQNALLGLVLPEASAYLRACGLNVQVQVTGDESCRRELARVVRVTQREDNCVLTVVYPPSLRLES